MKLCPTYRLAHAYLLKVYEKERHIFRIFVSGGQPAVLWLRIRPLAANKQLPPLFKPKQGIFVCRPICS
jgi:hypothetical protein